MSKTLVIFDLDSCLIDDHHRLPLIDWKARDFSKYHSPEAMWLDKALPVGTLLVEKARELGHEIVIFTARPVSAANQTIDQLSKLFGLRGGEFPYALVMRAADQEGISSAQLKAKMYDEFVKHPHSSYENVYAFDDHPDVIKAYTELGADAWLVSKSVVCSGKLDEALTAIRHGQTYKTYGRNLQFMTQQHTSVFIEEPMKRIQNPYINHLLETALVSCIRPVDLQQFAGTARGLPLVPECNVDNQYESLAKKSLNGMFKELDALTSLAPEPTPFKINARCTRIAADVLEDAAATFRERNEVYKDNAHTVGKVMLALFPNGVKLETPEDFHMWHLFELLIVKLTRFTNSGLTHQDSILDLTVYSAMLEPLINTHKIKIK